MLSSVALIFFHEIKLLCERKKVIVVRPACKENYPYEKIEQGGNYLRSRLVDGLVSLTHIFVT